jgi:hypothetical protein
VPLIEAGMTGTARSFAPNQAEAIQEAAIATDKPKSGNLWSLLLTESQIIKGAREAGYDMAKFTALNNVQPSEAVKALANFGARLTETFNANVQGIYGGAALRPLATALFIEAAAVLDANAALAATQMIAMLEVTILKRGAEFQMPQFLDGKVPKTKDILIHEPIIN